jgi:hypothetical protein
MLGAIAGHQIGCTRLILEVWALRAGNYIHDREGRGRGSVVPYGSTFR